MNFKSSSIAAFSLCVACVLLPGCGGGDGGGDDLGNGGDASSTSGNLPEGAYGGTLSGSTSSDFQALALPSGEFWSLYGVDTGSMFYVDGFAQGSGTSNQSKYTTQNLKDFGFKPALSANMTVSYDVASRAISGVATYAGQTVRLTGGPIPGSLYRYDLPASLSTVAGHWDAMTTEGSMMSVDIKLAGTLTLSDNGCNGSGTIRGMGRNYFDVQVTFGGLPCALPNQTATGIVVAYPLSTGQTQIIGALVNSARTVGIAAFGIR